MLLLTLFVIIIVVVIIIIVFVVVISIQHVDGTVSDEDVNKSLSEVDIESSLNNNNAPATAVHATTGPTGATGEWSLEEVKRALSLLKWQRERHHHQVCTCGFIYLFIYLFIYAFIYLFIYLFIYTCIYLFIYLFIAGSKVAINQFIHIQSLFIFQFSFAEYF